ncbi:MAG: hypothetical protein ACD_77C00437G0006 [uncultured bacterium]|nr:MAG: hypothetical protein ACD_77C00437G0006 [uncultured bacterium]
MTAPKIPDNITTTAVRDIIPPACPLRTIAIGVVIDLGNIVIIVSILAPIRIDTTATLTIAPRLPKKVADKIAAPLVRIKL